MMFEEIQRHEKAFAPLYDLRHIGPRHMTLEQCAEALYQDDLHAWEEGGRTGKKPHLLTRERIRQIERSALRKCIRWAKANCIDIKELLPGE